LPCDLQLGQPGKVPQQPDLKHTLQVNLIAPSGIRNPAREFGPTTGGVHDSGLGVAQALVILDHRSLGETAVHCVAPGSRFTVWWGSCYMGVPCNTDDRGADGCG
jgi:hypothetical protein